MLGLARAGREQTASCIRSLGGHATLGCDRAAGFGAVYAGFDQSCAGNLELRGLAFLGGRVC